MATTAPARAVPAHVPPELVVDIDIYDIPGGEVDPQTAWRNFKGKGPLVYSPYNGGHWVPTNGADVFKIYRDTRHFSSRMVAIPDPGADRMLPIQADPPMHSKYRANVQGFFTPSAIAEYDPKIRETAVDLIEGFRSRGSCEFVSEFALQLPLFIFLDIMGLPREDRLQLREQVETFLKGDPQAMVESHVTLHRYLDGWIEKRSANPGNDGISIVTRATIDGRPFTHEEMLATLTLLLHAGLDTVGMMLSFIALHLARNPADRNYIRANCQKMHKIVQELLRRYAGPNPSRVVAMDHSFKGVSLKEGDRIILVPSLFNMDEETLADPDTVDFSNDARHITFGAGPHTCAGALLARSEIAIFLEEWLTRIPDFAIDPARPPKLKTGIQNSVNELWLTWPA